MAGFHDISYWATPIKILTPPVKGLDEDSGSINTTWKINIKYTTWSEHIKSFNIALIQRCNELLHLIFILPLQKVQMKHSTEGLSIPSENLHKT